MLVSDLTQYWQMFNIIQLGSESGPKNFIASCIMSRPYNHVKASLGVHAVIIVYLTIAYYPCGGVGGTYGVVCLLGHMAFLVGNNILKSFYEYSKEIIDFSD